MGVATVPFERVGPCYCARESAFQGSRPTCFMNLAASPSRTAVLVNGAIVVKNSVHTGALPGKVLRRDHAGARGLK